MNQPDDLVQSIWLIEDYFKPNLREGQHVLSKFSEQFDYSINIGSAYTLVMIEFQALRRFSFFLFYLKMGVFSENIFVE